MQLRRSRNRRDPRFPGKHPRERNLRGRRFLLLGELPDQINQSLIRTSRLGRKARDGVAKIRAVELRVLVNFSGEESFAERAEQREADS